MIRGDIYIEFIDPPGALSIGVIPVVENPLPMESMGWHFLGMGIQAAQERIIEQMAENSNHGQVTNAPHGGEAAKALKANMEKLGGFRRLSASFMLVDNPRVGLGYFLTYPPDACPHPAEAAAWKTIKLALDTASDWWDLPTSYTGVQEDDEDNLRETLRKALATLPVFPKFEKERK